MAVLTDRTLHKKDDSKLTTTKKKTTTKAQKLEQIQSQIEADVSQYEATNTVKKPALPASKRGGSASSSTASSTSSGTKTATKKTTTGTAETTKTDTTDAAVETTPKTEKKVKLSHAAEMRQIQDQIESDFAQNAAVEQSYELQKKTQKYAEGSQKFYEYTHKLHGLEDSDRQIAAALQYLDLDDRRASADKRVESAKNRIEAVQNAIESEKPKDSLEYLKQRAAAYTPAGQTRASNAYTARQKFNSKRLSDAENLLRSAQKNQTNIANQQIARDYERKYLTAENPTVQTRAFATSNADNIVKAVDNSLSSGRVSTADDEAGGEWYNLARHMTDDQKNVILNLAAKGLYDDVETYANAIKPSLTELNFKTQRKTLNNAPKVGQVATGLAGSLAAPAAYAQIVADTVTGKDTDLNAGAVGATRLTNRAKQLSLEKAGKVGQTLGQVGYSMVDSLTSSALGPVGSLIWLGTSAAGNSAIDTLERGGTQGQAVAMGAVSGGIEAATEKLGLDNLFDVVLKSGGKGVRALIKGMATQTLSEGAEEVISEFAGNLADIAIMGEASEYKMRVKELRASGLSEKDATSQATQEFFVRNPAMAGLAGSISGFLFGAAGSAISSMQANQVNKTVARNVENDGSVDLYINAGLGLDQNSTGYKAAQKLQSDVQAGKTVDARTLGKLRSELSEDTLDSIGREEGLRREERLARQRAEQEQAELEETARQAEEAARIELGTRQQQTDTEKGFDVDRAVIDADTGKNIGEMVDPTVPTAAQRQSVRTNENRSPAAMDAAARQAEEAVSGDLGTRAETLPTAAETTQLAQAETQTENKRKKWTGFSNMSKSEKLNLKQRLNNELTDSSGHTNVEDVSAVADSVESFLNAMSDRFLSGNPSGEDVTTCFNAAYSTMMATMTRAYENTLTAQSDAAVASMPRVKEDYREAYDFIRDEVKNNGLYIPGDVKSDVGKGSWYAWRKANVGWLRGTNSRNAMGIDVLYSELSERFPGFFNGETTINAADQLQKLSDFMTKEAINSADNATDVAAAGGLTAEEIQRQSSDAAKQTLRDIMDAYQLARYESATSAASSVPSSSLKRLPTVTATNDVSAYRSVYEAGKSYTSEEIMQLTDRSARENGVSDTVSLEISNLAGRLASKVEFADLGTKYNGYYNRESDIIVLNSRLGANDAIWTTYAHELTHRAESSKNYKTLASFVRRDANLNNRAYEGVLQGLIDMYKADGVTLSMRDAEHEFMASYLSTNILGNLDALQGLANTDPDAARVLLDSVEGVLTDATEGGIATDIAQDRLVKAQSILSAALDDVNRMRGTGRYAETGFTSQESLTDYLPTGSEAEIAGFDINSLIAQNVEKYGKISEGEQLYDIDDPSFHTTQTTLPKKTGTGNMRKFYRTAEESAGYHVDARDKAVLDTYTPVSNEENLSKASDIRSSYESFDQAYGAFRSWAQSGFSGKDTAAQIAFGEKLMLEAQKAGRYGESVEILSDLAVAGTQYGQAVQALSLLKRLTPEGQIYHYARQAENYAKRRGNAKASRETRKVQGARDALDGALETAGELEATAEAVKNGEATGTEFQQTAEEMKRQLKALEKKLARGVTPDQTEIDSELAQLLKRKAELERALSEKKASQEELSAIRREYNALPKKIDAAQKKTLANINEQKELLTKLADRKAELERALNEHDRTNEERKMLKRELAKTNSRITGARKTWSRYANSIREMTAAMADAEITPDNAKQYRKTIKSAQALMKAYLRFVKNKGGEVTIDETLMNDFINAKTEEDLTAAREALETSIAEQLPGSVSERIRAVRYIGMLLNPTTHLRNIAGNTVQLGMKGLRDFIATGGEKLFIKNGERTKSVLTGKDSALKAYATQDYAEIKDDLQAGGKQSETAGIENKRKIFKTKAAEAVRRFSSDTLEAEDALFLRSNYVQSFAEYMKANKLTTENITEAQKTRAREVAFDEALKATYRDASRVADLLNKLEKSSAASEFVFGGLMPFKKTPINVLKRGLEYSPAGLIKGTYEIIQKAQGKDVTASQIISDLSAGVTGSIVTALGVVMGAFGTAFASGGEDEKDRKTTMEEETGRQDYSIKFGDYTYTMDWVSPASMPFFVGVSLAQFAKRENKDLTASEVVESVLGIMEPVFSLSMLSGITDMFKSYESSGAGVAASVGWSAVESYVLQFFPTFFGKMARVVDDTRRSTYAPSDSPYSKKAEQLARRIMAKIPGVSKLLEPSVDQYGNERKNVGGEWWGRLLYNTLSPGYAQKITSIEEDEEMKRLYAQTGDTDVLPRTVPKNVAYKGETYYLDSAAYTQYAKTLGSETYSGLDALYKTKAYQKAGDEDRVDMVRDVMDKASEKAKMEYFDSIGLTETIYRDSAETALYGMDGQKKPKESVVDLYDSGVLELGDVYNAYEAVTDSVAGSKTTQKIAALDALDIGDDEKNFVYMTKIASASAQADVQAIIDNGASMTDAVGIVRSMYDMQTGDALKKDGKVDLILESNLPDEAKEAAYYALVSKSDFTKDAVKTFRKAGMDMDDFLSAQAAFTGEDGDLKQAEKLAALRDLDVEDKATVVTTLVTTSENIANGMKECMKMGFTGDQFVEAYAQYAEINTSDAKPTEKAVKFSRWVNKHFSGKSEEARTFLKDVLSYYQQMKADAGKYDSLYAAGVSDKAAISLYNDLKNLKPESGKTTVSDNQKVLAIAKNKTASKSEQRIAIMQIIGDSTSAVTKFESCEKAGISYEIYANYITKVSGLSADKDANGKSISGSKKAKVVNYIDNLSLTPDQKDALYLAEGYAKSDLGSVPWN